MTHFNKFSVMKIPNDQLSIEERETIQHVLWRKRLGWKTPLEIFTKHQDVALEG